MLTISPLLLEATWWKWSGVRGCREWSLVKDCSSDQPASGVQRAAIKISLLSHVPLKVKWHSSYHTAILGKHTDILSDYNILTLTTFLTERRQATVSQTAPKPVLGTFHRPSPSKAVTPPEESGVHREIPAVTDFAVTMEMETILWSDSG